MPATATPEKESPVELQEPRIIAALKSIVCVMAFLIAVGYFASVCAQAQVDYFMVFVPSKETTLPWAVRLCFGALAVMLMTGIMAVLIRPVWLAAATFGCGMLVYAYFLSGGSAIWYAAAAAGAIFIGLLISIVKQLENQIDFSSRPMGDKELLLSSILALLVAVPCGLGYVKDAERGHYVIPPRITAALQTQAEGYVETMVSAQGIPAVMRDAAMSMARDQTRAMIEGMQKAAEPYAPYVPYVLGALAYFTFQLVLVVPGVIAALLLGPVLFFLRIIGFAHLSKETRVVTRLRL